MSRSYKKVCISKPSNDQFFKKYSNRIFRRRPINDEKEDFQYGDYKKFLGNWLISEFKSLEPYLTFPKFKEWYLEHIDLFRKNHLLSDREIKRIYYKWYRNK